MSSNAIIEIDNRKKNYNEMYDAARRTGSFISFYTQPRDIVVISKSTSFEQIEAFIGCLLYNRIPVIIPHPSNKVRFSDFNKKMNKIDKSIHPKLCIADPCFHDLFSNKWKTISQIIDCKVIKTTQAKPNDIFFMQLSSGTTDIPKIISISQKALLAHCHEYANFIGLTKQDVIVSWLPLYHDMGLIACFLLPIIMGCSFVHINPFKWIVNPIVLFEKINEYKGNYVWMPNFAFSLLSKFNSLIELSSLKQIINCSEVCHQSDMIKFVNKFSNNGIKKSMIRICYAMAENIFAVAQSDNLNTDADGIVNCGTVIPGTSVIIVKKHQDGKYYDVTEKESGDIYIKSSYEPLSNTSDFFGFYKTGDRGYMKSGSLFVFGRSDDIIIHYGKNIYPYAIENYVSSLSGVIAGRVACFGIYKENIGTQLIYVCFEGNISSDLVREQVYKMFDLSVIVHCKNEGWIVKTSSGKISRNECKKRFINNE